MSGRHVLTINLKDDPGIVETYTRLHREVWPDVAPKLVIYDTATRGTANPNDRSRDRDRLDLAEKIDLIDHTAARRIAEVPNYPRLIRYTCERIGHSEEEFRCYRCRVKYPLYGSQICMTFLPPREPGAGLAE